MLIDVTTSMLAKLRSELAYSTTSISPCLINRNRMIRRKFADWSFVEAAVGKIPWFCCKTISRCEGKQPLKIRTVHNDVIQRWDKK